MYSRFFSFKKSYFSPLSRFLLCHLNDPDSIILNNATDWLKGYSNFHKGKYFEERLENLAQLTSIAFIFFLLWKSMVPNNCLVPIVPLCSAEERNSYRFATT